MKPGVLLLLLLCCLTAACGGKPSAPATTAATPGAVPAAASPPPPAPIPVADAAAPALPLGLTRRTGDLDVMMSKRNIRALVVTSRTDFFYDKGQPRGIVYEALEEFQRFLNKKLKTGVLKTTVTFIPVRGEQLESALTEGVGDVLATEVFVTPERAKKVLFTVPIVSDARKLIVTGPSAPQIKTVEDLAGVEVYASPLTVGYTFLEQLSRKLQAQGKPAIVLKAADKNLTQEDLLEMVDAGLVPATIAGSRVAEFWGKVMPQLSVHSDLVLHEDGDLAWAVRKDSPKLKELLDEFIEGHRLGTAFGNTVLRRYLQSAKYVKNSTATADMEKFRAYVGYFKKYGQEYDFDYLMLAAQGYQESLLDQSRHSKSGAVGIMQVIPKYAAAKPISIAQVDQAENNIHAGAKMLRNIQDNYFNDSDIDPLNKMLLSFASYNAGPNRIARLRREAKAQGLDPDQWFGNVDLVAAKDIGQETVQYVSNIYKYYIAYKLILEQSQKLAPVRAQPPSGGPAASFLGG